MKTPIVRMPSATRAAGARATLPHAMSETVVIDRQYCGPPGVAHGGYACGLIAERVGAPAVTVSLRAPAPLGEPLTLAGAVLRAGDQILAEGREADLRLDVPAPVTVEEARRAAADCPWRERHPFPE